MTQGTVTLQNPYVPNPKQEEFHGLTAKYRAFCGGWGNGKTTAGCAEFFIRLMEFPGTNSIIARKTRPELRTTTWEMFIHGDTQPHGWQGVPQEVIKQYNKSDLFLELKNGSKVHGLPLDDPKKLENYNLGLFMIDQAEEVDEEIFLKFHGRLRQHNSPREGLLLFNPNGHWWGWRRFIDPKREEKHPGWPARYKVVEATPFDNPNLPEDYLEQFDGLPQHWYDRFVLGSHDVFIGQIFVDFEDDLHVIDPFRIPRHWERWMCIDPGIGHEAAVNWIARDPENNCFVYREIVKAGEPVDWWVEAIDAAETAMDWGGPDEGELDVIRLIGPESQQRSQTDARTVKGVFEEEGLNDLELADRDPTARINRITSRLRLRPGHVAPFGDGRQWTRTRIGETESTTGAPTLYIFRDCEYTVEHLPQYKWRPVRAQAVEEDAAEKPVKKNDHTIDNIGHILVAMGDSEPEVPTVPDVPGAEQRELEEHFESELRAAEQRSASRGYSPGRVPSTVG